MQVEDEGTRRLIRLVGRLSATQVHELLEASRSHQAVLRLDLAELISVDLIGLEVLLDLKQNGAKLLRFRPTFSRNSTRAQRNAESTGATRWTRFRLKAEATSR